MIELIQNKQVFFEPLTHSYWLPNGTELIGLTSLMQKHSLGADYSGVPEKTLKKAAEEGTAIHKMLEDYDNGEAILFTPLIEQYRKLGLKHLASEFLVSDNTKVATFLDKVYEVDDHTVDIADVKTTTKVHKTALAWQLGVGKYLFELQNPGISVRNTFCVWCDKRDQVLKGVIPITPVSTEQVEELLACEREGRIYIDLTETPEAGLVLSEEEISDVVAKAAKVDELKQAVKEMEAALGAYYDKVRDYMVEHDLEELATDGGVFKLKKAYERTSIDTAAVKRYAPELYTKCSKTTTVAASVSFKRDGQGK